MSKKGAIVLNEKKEINSKEYPAGTILAIVDCQDRFTVEDVDIAMQLQEVKLQPRDETKKG